MARIRKERTIAVTQVHIDTGVPCDPHRCTIQMAIEEAFPEAEKVEIASALAEVTINGDAWNYRLPKIACCVPKMIDLGMREEVLPFSFVLKRPLIVRKPRQRSDQDKPVKVRSYKRALPGDGETEERELNVGNRTQSAVAKMQRALKRRFAAGTATIDRFDGVGI